MSASIVVTYTGLTVPVGSQCCYSIWPNGACDERSYTTKLNTCDTESHAETGPVYLRIGDSIPLLLQNRSSFILENEVIDAYLKSIGSCFSVKGPTVVTSAPAYTGMLLSLFVGMLIMFAFQKIVHLIKSKRGQAYVRHANHSDV